MERGYTRREALRLGGAAVAGAGLAASATGGALGETAFTTTDLTIQSWDGTELAATVYEPEPEGPHPAMLITHGWGLDHERGIFSAETYASNGYVVLAYTSRGFGESEGEVGVDGPNEVRDARHLITWLARRENVRSDGDDPHVGMDGQSYAGGIQLNTAAVDDRIDAIVPRIAWHDLRYSLEPNGVVKAGWATGLAGLGTASARGLVFGDFLPGPQDVEGLNPRVHEALVRGAVTNDIPEGEERFFAVRSPGEKLDAIAASDTPCLVVSGWVDTLFTPTEAVANFEGLRGRGADTRLLFYDGGHTAGPELLETPPHVDAAALDWIETYVRGQAAAGTSDRPPVEFFEMQTGEWETAPAIPRPEHTERTVSLADAAGEGESVVVNTVAPTSLSEFVPADALRRDAPVVAQFDVPVEEPFEVFGSPTAELAVEPLGTEARLFLKVYHVTDGGATLVDKQVTPVRVESESGLALAEPRTVEVELTPFQRTFAAGDTLRFAIAATDAGYFASRESLGARIAHEGSTLTLPTTPVEGPVPGDGGAGEPNVTVTREDDGTVFTGGGTNQVSLTVEADRPVRIRDRTPTGWVVRGGDEYRRSAPPETDGNYTEFVVPVASGTRTYFAEAPSGVEQTSRATFGPVEFSTDGGRTWTVVSGTTDDNLLVGASGP